MVLSAFADPSVPPTAEALAAALGPSRPLWERLLAFTRDLLSPGAEVWHFAGRKFGWSLRVKQGDRVILYLTPQDGVVLAGLVLGEKAARAAEEAELPAAALSALQDAPRYAEGRGLRIAVSSAVDAAAVEALLPFKAARTLRMPVRPGRGPSRL